jgi:CubicO group peptidase (beta-lactamase class C family)
VTLRDLFAHRSGLYGDAGNDLESLGFDRDTILSRLRYLEPGGPFRASYAYSNFGITAGGVAAAAAAGKTWEEVTEDELYAPLGMTQTSSRYLDFTKRPERARLHILKDGVWVPGPVRNADAQSPAGGVSSSVQDLAQWLRLQLGEGTLGGQQIVSEAALAETHQPEIVRGPNPITGALAFYGLGWNVDYDNEGYTYISHAGAFSMGARTLVKMLPAEDLGIIVLSNAFPTGVPEGLPTPSSSMSIVAKQPRTGSRPGMPSTTSLLRGSLLPPSRTPSLPRSSPPLWQTRPMQDATATITWGTR